jgi:hypothetical protein
LADNIVQSPPPFAPIEQPEGEARREDACGKARPGDEARRSGNPEPSFGSSETRLCTGKKQPAFHIDRQTIGSIRFSEAPFERLAEIGVNDAVVPWICESGFVDGAYGFVWTKLGDKFH